MSFSHRGIGDGGAFLPRIHRIPLGLRRSSPKYLRRSIEFAYYRRWSRMLAISAVSTFTASLLLEQEQLETEGPVDGEEPWLQDVMAEARHDDPVGPSRLR